MTDNTPSATHDGIDQIIMSARSISKNYGGVHALRDVDFDIRRGRVTVLFGENGAGKSTLMKILSGVELPSSGEIWLDRQAVNFDSANDAAALGVAIIHQELNLVPNLSIADNIFMGHEELGRLGLGVNFGKERERSVELLARLDEDLDPNTLVSDLRLGQQQLVEIAKALAGDTRVLIMDEPTSALSSNEVAVLFRVIHDLKRNGVAIVYISHHLEEAVEIADYAVVLRDGQLVGKDDAKNIDIQWVVRHMVGRSSEVAPVDLRHEFGNPVLNIKDLVVPDPSRSDRIAVAGFTLDIRRGEVVCLYGLMGAGRTELLECIAGRGHLQSGEIILDDEDVTNLTIAERIDRGLALVPEDRQRDGLVQTLSIAANLTLSTLGRFVRGLFLSKKEQTRSVSESITDIRIKVSSPNDLVTALSGGNQQKVVIGRVLMTGPKVLLLDEPTRGIDVGAKAEIFALMGRAAERGMAVLYATSEVSEALTVSTKIVVMSRGLVVGVFDPATTTREQIMAASGESDLEATGGVPATAEHASAPASNRGVHK